MEWTEYSSIINFHIQFTLLSTSKNERLQRVEKHIDKVYNLSAVLGMDSSMIITKVHPSLNELCGMSKNISDSILAKLNSTVKSLEEEKQKRLEKVMYMLCYTFWANLFVWGAICLSKTKVFADYIKWVVTNVKSFMLLKTKCWLALIHCKIT